MAKTPCAECGGSGNVLLFGQTEHIPCNACGGWGEVEKPDELTRLRSALLQSAEDLERASARLATIHTLLSRELSDCAKRAYNAAGREAGK